jgi:hypothetical protein
VLKQFVLILKRDFIEFHLLGVSHPDVIARFASPYANLLRRPFSISLCRLEVPFCKS